MVVLPSYHKIKSKFRNELDRCMYVILLASYVNHLDSKRKLDFINSTSIDKMIYLLSSKEQKYLKILLNKVYTEIETVYSKDKPKKPTTPVKAKPNASKIELDEYNALLVKHKQNKEIYEKEYDEWIKSESTVRMNCTSSFLKGKYASWLSDILNETNWIKTKKSKTKFMSAFDELDTKLTRINPTSLDREKIIKNYKDNLSKFDGNSVEYRKYLILAVNCPWISELGKIYDIKVILSRMHIALLNSILSEIPMYHDISAINYIEPYFKCTQDEKNAFKFSADALKIQVKKILDEKIELLGNKITNLKVSPRLYEDALEIIISIKNKSVTSQYIKQIFSEYSGPFSNGTVFTDVLRGVNNLYKLANSPKLIESISNKILLIKFRNKIMKIREVMLKSLLSKPYIAYRGIGYNGLCQMFKNGNYAIPEEFENFDYLTFKKINEKKPIIFDRAFMSASLNKKVAEEFAHKQKSNSALIEMTFPANCHAIITDLEELPSVPDEEEIIIKEATRFKIQRVSMPKNDNYKIKLQVTALK